uniref:Secreted protein n=1 Tax=Rhizophora mucronata TaxID=61149 RepID=A0A2P2P1G3_RHIMU
MLVASMFWTLFVLMHELLEREALELLLLCRAMCHCICCCPSGKGMEGIQLFPLLADAYDSLSMENWMLSLSFCIRKEDVRVSWHLKFHKVFKSYPA